MTWLLLMWLSGGRCLATVFAHEGDRYDNGRTACLSRPLRDDERGVAHRHLPCGTRVLLVNPRNSRSVVARVVDRGPYGAKVGRRWIVKRSESETGTWRGCLDLTPATARALGHNGLEELIFVPLAQQEERRRDMPEVVGSRPAGDTGGKR